MASFMVSEEALITFPERAEKAGVSPGLINNQLPVDQILHQCGFARPRTEDHDTQDGDIWVDPPENVKIPVFPQNLLSLHKWPSPPCWGLAPPAPFTYR